MKTSRSTCPQQGGDPNASVRSFFSELRTFPRAWDRDPGVPGATGWHEKRRAAAVQDVVVLFPLGQSLRER